MKKTTQDTQISTFCQKFATYVFQTKVDGDSPLQNLRNFVSFCDLKLPLGRHILGPAKQYTFPQTLIFHIFLASILCLSLAPTGALYAIVWHFKSDSHFWIFTHPIPQHCHNNHTGQPLQYQCCDQTALIVCLFVLQIIIQIESYMCCWVGLKMR